MLRLQVVLLVCLGLLAISCGGGSNSTGPDSGPDLASVDGGLADIEVRSSPDTLTDSVPPDLGSPDIEALDLESEDTPVEDVYTGEYLILLENGVLNYSIVLNPEPSPSEQFAAEELQSHFELCTGKTLPILAQPPEDGTSMIVLGMGPVSEELGVAPNPQELGEQGYQLKTVSPHIVIAGTPEAGTLYGVYRFLEDNLGVRWYAPGVTKTPQTELVRVRPVDKLVTPAFLMRDTSYRWEGRDDAFLARMGENSGGNGPDSPTGIQHAHDGRAHSYFWYVSPGEYWNDHPEYFSEIGGERVLDDTQLCLTNPEVLDIVTEKMLSRMAGNPGARQHNFSQNDYYNYCECDLCRAKNEDLGTTGGTQFWFVNQLAERTSQEFPEKLIGTLAYTYTEEPPKGMTMHPNVAVWLCHMFPSCDSHPIATCPLNADYKRRAEAWSQITDHLYVWHYIVDFTHYYSPFPNFRAMAEDMKFYRDIGVEGVFLQGMGHGGGGGEFHLLRPYYGMKLLWNPDQDPLKIRDDFLQGYYGGAWEPIRDYMELLQDKVDDEDIHMHLYTNPGQGYFTDDILAAAEALFQQALDLVQGDEELTDRVLVAKMPLTYAKLFPRNGYEIVGNTLKWLGEMAGIQEFTDFMNMMESHGFTTIREVGGEIELLMLVYSIVSSDLEIRPISNEQLRVEVVPSLGGRALRIIDKASGKSVTSSNVVQSLYFPFAGGMDDRVGGLFLAYGWAEPATVVEHTATSITTRQNTLNGYRLLRTITMDPDLPVIHVETSVTNTDGGTKTTRLRNHLELDLGQIWDTRVSFTSLDGQDLDQDMSPVIEGLREGQHFYDLDVPDGEWTFTGPNGLQVIQRFDNQEVDYTCLISFPDTHNLVEVEVWSPKVELESGATLVLKNDLEVRAQ